MSQKFRKLYDREHAVLKFRKFYYRELVPLEQPKFSEILLPRDFLKAQNFGNFSTGKKRLPVLKFPKF